jgi:hypothetical protein
LKAAYAITNRASEGAAHVAKKFAHKQIALNRSAIDFDQWPSGALAAFVNGAGCFFDRFGLRRVRVNHTGERAEADFADHFTVNGFVIIDELQRWPSVALLGVLKGIFLSTPASIRLRISQSKPA